MNGCAMGLLTRGYICCPSDQVQVEDELVPDKLAASLKPEIVGVEDNAPEVRIRVVEDLVPFIRRG